MKTTRSILLFYVLPLLVCSCTSPLPYKFPLGPSMEEFISALPVEERPATPVARNRDAHGRFILPLCPQCNGPAVLTCTTYRCAKGHKYETPDTDLH